MALDALLDILKLKRCHDGPGEGQFCRSLQARLESFGPAALVELDSFGNLFVSTDSSSRTLFTAHVDTVHNDEGIQGVIFDSHHQTLRVEHGGVLGADDGAGVWMLLELIQARLPGAFVFFRGEECGCLGSRAALQRRSSWFSRFERAVAFDRRSTCSVITRMFGENTCSQTFAEVLCAELNAHGLNLAPDDSGIVTDTYTFKDLVPECTNISVGFASAHSDREWLDVGYLQRLRQAALAVDWESLPTWRKP